MRTNKIPKTKAEAEAMDYVEICPLETICRNTICHIITGLSITITIVVIFTSVLYFY